MQGGNGVMILAMNIMSGTNLSELAHLLTKHGQMYVANKSFFK